MLEQTSPVVSRARSLRTLALVVPAVAACLALPGVDHPPYIGEGSMERIVPYFEPAETVECVIRRLLGLPCADDLENEPPPPVDPIQPLVPVT